MNPYHTDLPPPDFTEDEILGITHKWTFLAIEARHREREWETECTCVSACTKACLHRWGMLTKASKALRKHERGYPTITEGLHL